MSRICFTRCVVLSLLSAFSVQNGYTQSNPPIVISQVYGGGGNSGATLRNDFIELFNRGASTVDVTGWTVQHAAATGSSWDRTLLFGLIEPGQYFLVVEAQGTGGTVSLPPADVTGGLALSATSAKVVLARSSTALTGQTPSRDDIVDIVGYGDSNYSLGRPTGGLSSTTAALRRGNGCTDTRNNQADFSIGAPAPRNRQSSWNPCVSVPPPDATAPSVTMTQPSAGSTIAGRVTIAATATDNVGVIDVQFYVDGNPVHSPDNSSPYSILWDSNAVENGSHTLSATARDAVGNRGVSGPIIVLVRNQSPVLEPEGPRITNSVNGASFMPGPVAPGELVTLFGSDLGPIELVRMDVNSEQSAAPTILSGTRVLFDGVPAPIYFATSTAVSAFVPYSIAGRSSTTVTVEVGGRESNPVALQVVGAAPGIFSQDSSGRGQAWSLNEDLSINGDSSPAKPGSLITILATGGGQTLTASEDGHFATSVAPVLTSTAFMTVAGRECEVLSAGAAQGNVNGIIQVTARIPQDLDSFGALGVAITIDGARSQPGIYLYVGNAGLSDTESLIDSRLRELKTNASVPLLAEVPHDRISTPTDWLALVSWNTQVGGTSTNSETRPPMVKNALNELFGGSYHLLAAQEIPNSDSSDLLRSMLPGGALLWQSSFFDTSDSMDNGFYYRNGIKLRDSAPLFVTSSRDAAGRYLTDDTRAEHPPQVAQFEAGDFDFTLVTVHLTFADGDTKASAREFTNLLDYLDWYFKQPGHDPDVIVCGDFNIPSQLSGETGKDRITLDSILNADPRFQTGERRFAVTVHEPTSRSPAANGGGPAHNYDHCVLSADTMEEFIQARRVDPGILTNHPEDPEERLTSDHFPIVGFFRTQGPGVILDHRPTIRRPVQ